MNSRGTIWRISRRSSSDGTPTIVIFGAKSTIIATAGTGREGWPGDGGWWLPFDPDLSPRDRPALWHPAVAAAVVPLAAAPAGVAGIALPASARPLISHADREAKHLVIDAGGTRHRLWITAEATDDPLIILLSPSRDPLRIGAADAARALLAGDVATLAGALSPSAFQRHRLTLLVAVLDTALAGASARRIGHEIVYPRLAGQSATAWKGSSERRQVQRLIAEAKAMTTGGYRALLAGDPTNSVDG